MDRLGMEIRFALRSLAKRPLTTITVVVTLALALGANAAIFGVIDALVLRPFPMRDVDRIIMPVAEVPNQQFRQDTVSPADFLDWRRETATGGAVERLAASQWWDASLVGQDEPERVLGFFVSTDFFAVMGVQPALGRAFLPEEETLGNERRVLLADGLWKRRFGGDPAVIGRSVLVDGAQSIVVGVMPPGFDFPLGSELWAPLAFDAKTAANRSSRYLTVVGRLRPGGTIADAQAQLSLVADRLTRDNPTTNRDRTIRVFSLERGMMDVGLGAILALWQAAAVVVLLIASANTANLLLARAAERAREIAVRIALGSSRGRIVRESLVESVVLGLMAVPASLGVTWVGLRLIHGYLPPRIVRFVAGWDRMGIDGRTIAFTTLTAVVVAIGFGVLPAIQFSRRHVADTLKSDGRTGAGPGRERLRRALVVAEIALVLPLLVAATSSVNGVRRYLTSWQGYDPNGILTLRLVLPDARYPDADSRRRFVASALDALHAAPGATSAAAGNVVPAITSNAVRRIEIRGQPVPDPLARPSVDYRTVSASYFDVFRIPMLTGRAFSSTDRPGTEPVAIVSQSMAHKFWPDGRPIGGQVRIGDGEWLTVVGVCGDVIHDWFDRRNAPTLYRPIEQDPVDSVVFALRTRGDPLGMVAAARRAIASVDAQQPTYNIMPMRQVLSERTVGIRFVAGIMGTFAGLALVLAVLGLYAVMTYLVTLRVHEIGVRIALGATTSDVTRLTLGQAARLTGAGVGIGFALAIALARLIEAGLVGVASAGAWQSVALAAALAATALASSYLPAKRAAAVDPIVALRAE
jgi:putative ABC transport system permease protein